MAGLPVAAVLSQLRAPSGARLPVEVTELVASLVPRSFSSLPRPRFGEVVSPGELREKIYRYIVAGEGVGGPETFPGEYYSLYPESLHAIVEHGIELLFFIGLEDRVTLLSIFKPPVWGYARQRAWLLMNSIYERLYDWLYKSAYAHGGQTPAFHAFDANLEAWWVVRGSGP